MGIELDDGVLAVEDVDGCGIVIDCDIPGVGGGGFCGVLCGFLIIACDNEIPVICLLYLPEIIGWAILEPNDVKSHLDQKVFDIFVVIYLWLGGEKLGKTLLGEVCGMFRWH